MKFDTKIETAPEKIAIKEFVDTYNNKAEGKFQESYLKDTIKTTPYLPFLTKVALAEGIVRATMFRYKKVKDEETGEMKREKTNDLNFNSVTQVLLFVRCVIENYTNLVVETEGFYEEYDMLVASGVLKQIMNLIPEAELAEFRSILDMEIKDLLDNYSNQNSYLYKELQQKKLKAFSDGFLGSFMKTLQENVDPDVVNSLIGLAEESDESNLAS